MSAISAVAPSVVSKEFDEPQRSQVRALVAEATGLVKDVVALVTNYAIHDLFGSAEWKRYFNQDVGEEPSLPDAFWKFWHSRDPHDRTKKVWETHLPPVLRPEFVIDRGTRARQEFCLTVMGELMQKPKEGHASKYYYGYADSEAFRQNGRSEAGQACWLVMRKDVISRNQVYAQQLSDINKLKAGYEAGPSAVDLVTIVFTRFLVTQERYLGDDTGVEKYWTYSRCKETVKYGEKANQILVGGHSFNVWSPKSSGLRVDTINYSDDGASSAIAAVRKFSGN